MPDTRIADRPPPIIGGTCMYLSVVLLFNNFHYQLTGKKKTAYMVKTSFIVQEKWFCHENFCFMC